MKRIVKILLWLVLAVSLSAVIYNTYDEWKAERASEEAVQIAGFGKNEARPAPNRPEPKPKSEDEPVPEPEPEPLPDEAAHLANLDLAALREVNEDVIGWLEIPGTEVSYPLVQGTDNWFYLSYNWKKEASGAGAIFLEATNSSGLSDFHLIIYGHRMGNGSMFGSLKSYSGTEYFLEHPSVYLVDGAAVRRYDIFAVHEAGVRSIVYRLDVEESGLEQELLQFCLDSSVIDTGVIPQQGEQILTLSTCTGYGHAARWVVHGVLRGQYEL